jgi:hypothetical protein
MLRNSLSQIICRTNRAEVEAVVAYYREVVEAACGGHRQVAEEARDGHVPVEAVQQAVGTSKQEVPRLEGPSRQEVRQAAGLSRQEVQQAAGLSKQEVRLREALRKREDHRKVGLSKLAVLLVEDPRTMAVRQGVGQNRKAVRREGVHSPWVDQDVVDPVGERRMSPHRVVEAHRTSRLEEAYHREKEDQEVQDRVLAVGRKAGRCEAVASIQVDQAAASPSHGEAVREVQAAEEHRHAREHQEVRGRRQLKRSGS